MRHLMAWAGLMSQHLLLRSNGVACGHSNIAFQGNYSGA